MSEQKEIDQDDLEALGRAKKLLENPGFIARLANAVGTPVEKLLHALPKKAATSIEKATKAALEKALKVALATLGGDSGHEPSNIWHKIAVAATGAVGGAFGLLALPIELPVSATIMLRSIADIARTKGEDLRTPEAALACIEVFALGGRSNDDNAAESAYYAVRIALGKAVGEAAAYVVGEAAGEAAPALVRLIAAIAERFGVVVTEKVAAEFIPVIGGIGGAVINVAFMAHFQDMAEGHFTVRSLERKYGAELVRVAYATLPGVV